ncbi:hypothetical protein Glove_110g53 [Diversispora epigaea]|uniref:Uncharacterized protein n=1 Tax=Diversispora epigaea TaxID=1348612 RepID=A0A397J4B7_9GLOM|nr:hypothetical protein Glove_110g53 [Diversispora epigaea]
MLFDKEGVEASCSVLEAQRKKRCHLRNELDKDDRFDINEEDNQYTSEKHENTMLRLIEASKTWTSNSQRSLTYIGNSRTIKWRRKVSLKKAAMQIPTLETFFINTNNEENFNDEIEDINVEIGKEIEG